MDPIGWMIYIFILGTGIISGFAFLILLIVAALKKNKKLLKKALIVPTVYLFIFIFIILSNYLLSLRFDNIPELSIKNDRVRVLNFGTESMGSYSNYIFLNGDILEEVNEVKYSFHSAYKAGYLFISNGPGNETLVVTEYDCAQFAYGDIYIFNVNDDGNVVLLATEHVTNYEMSIEEFMNYLVEVYSFSENQVKELER